jgi:acetyl-CoA carboxylase biotin carboxyl carrier protein
VKFEELLQSRVRPLAQTLVREGLASLCVTDGEVTIEVSRTVGRPAEAGGSEGESRNEIDGPAPDYDVLTSDIVGRVRFLRPPVTVGTAVDADRELAFIEALGIRNPIRAHAPGRVAVVYVEEGQAVDYGAPLFAIDRSRV